MTQGLKAEDSTQVFWAWRFTKNLLDENGKNNGNCKMMGYFLFRKSWDWNDLSIG
jgi:antirestriction protein ArdC